MFHQTSQKVSTSSISKFSSSSRASKFFSSVGPLTLSFSTETNTAPKSRDNLQSNKSRLFKSFLETAELFKFTEAEKDFASSVVEAFQLADFAKLQERIAEIEDPQSKATERAMLLICSVLQEHGIAARYYSIGLGNEMTGHLYIVSPNSELSFSISTNPSFTFTSAPTQCENFDLLMQLIKEDIEESKQINEVLWLY